VITDATGLPLVVHTTPANVHDSIPAMEMLDRIPPCAGARGRPRFRPEFFQGDHAYGTPRNFAGAAARGVQTWMARLGQRDTDHGSGLGEFRYVIERTLAWFGHNRRLKVCYEKIGAHFQAFHELAAALILARRLSAANGF
jgi:transposase